VALLVKDGTFMARGSNKRTPIFAHSSNNPTNFPPSDAGNVNESRLMSQVWRLREYVCVLILPQLNGFHPATTALNNTVFINKFKIYLSF